MKLSDAIRLAGMEHPQAFGRYYSKEDDALCALGGAYKMVGGNVEDLNAAQEGRIPGLSAISFLKVVFPIATERVPTNLAGIGTGHANIASAVIFMNDCRTMSRNDIADVVAIWEQLLDEKEEARDVCAVARR